MAVSTFRKLSSVPNALRTFIQSMTFDDPRLSALNDVLVRFDAFVRRQHSRTGDERLSDDALDGLAIARDALEDIAAGRMRL